MKGLQNKFGKDKLEVLLLSVDQGYGMSQKEAAEGDRKIMKEHGINWQNVVVPDGWDEMNKRFGIDGYGLTLVGPDGKVLGRDLFPPDIESLLQDLYEK